MSMQIDTKTYFRGAQLLDGKNPPRPDVTVVVEGNQISAVTGSDQPAPQAPRPEDRVIDLGGQTLMPGMFFCHFHPAYDDVSDLQEIDLKHPPTYLTLVAAKNAELLLRSGFTGAVGAGAGHYIDVQLRNAVEAGLIQGPRIMACGRDVVTTGDSVDLHPSWWRLGLEGLAGICDGPVEFRKAVREDIKNGVDIVKLYVTGGHGPGLAHDVLSMTEEEIAAAVEAAHERGKKIRGHTINKRGILASARAGIDLIDHGDDLDAECIDLLVERGTFLAPSIYFSWNIIDDKRQNGKSDFESWIPELERNLEHHAEILPVADAAGIPLLIGDDFGLAWMPHGDYARELQAYVDVGIDPLSVIRWATINGAAVMGRADELGSIETGKLADLLVVDGDPIADITVLQDRAKLRAVMKDGAFVASDLKVEATASARRRKNAN